MITKGDHPTDNAGYDGDYYCGDTGEGVWASTMGRGWLA